MPDLPIRIGIFGKSILLAGIISTLNRNPDFVVSDVPADSAEMEIAVQKIDVLLFDSSYPETQSILQILERQLKVLVIGVDMQENRMTVYSGEGFKLGNLAHLSGLINDQFERGKPGLQANRHPGNGVVHGIR